MHHHIQLGNDARERRLLLRRHIRSGAIALGGYKKAKIYGLLTCSSGKGMKTANRVFFKNEAEALQQGYRPCGHCMPEKYKQWKQQLLQK